MIKKRPSAERGHLNFGWLDTYHTFSFGDYYDPEHIHFRHLRVMNEDRIDAGQGFGKHPHNDMEILTYVISGEIEHKDSMGNHIIIPAGNIQIMSAGTGILHSEYNPSPDNLLHLYQIWIIPQEKNLPPRYDQKDISTIPTKKWIKICSPSSEEHAVKIMQDVHIYAIKTTEDKTLDLPPYRYGWLQIVSGKGTLESLEIKAGDGVALHDEKNLRLQVEGTFEALFFDLA